VERYIKWLTIILLVLVLFAIMLYARHLSIEEWKESDLISIPQGQRLFLIQEELNVELPESDDLNSILCSLKKKVDAYVRAEFPDAYFQGIGISALSLKNEISISYIDFAYISRNVPKYTQLMDQRANLHFVSIRLDATISEGKAFIEHMDCRTMGEDYFNKAAKDKDICNLKLGWFDAVGIVQNERGDLSLGKLSVYKTSDTVKYFDGRAVWTVRCIDDSMLYRIDANSGEILNFTYVGHRPKAEKEKGESDTIEDVTE